MHKRIKELANKSEIFYTKDYDLGSVVVNRAEVKKFAELIIKECISEIHAAGIGNLYGESYYLDKVTEHIEKRFGITYE